MNETCNFADAQTKITKTNHNYRSLFKEYRLIYVFYFIHLCLTLQTYKIVFLLYGNFISAEQIVIVLMTNLFKNVSVVQGPHTT